MGWTTHWNLLWYILGLEGGWSPDVGKPSSGSNAPLIHSIMALSHHRITKRQRAQVWERGDRAPRSALGSHVTPQVSWLSFLGLGPKPDQ